MGLEKRAVLEQVSARSVCDDGPAVKKHDPAAGRPDKVQIVRSNDLGIVESPEIIDEQPASSRIEVRRRLVQDEDHRFHDQDSGERRLFFLSEAEKVGRSLELFPQTKRLENPNGPRLGFLRTHAETGGTEKNVF